jgi:hypothetical protein
VWILFPILISSSYFLFFVLKKLLYFSFFYRSSISHISFPFFTLSFIDIDDGPESKSTSHASTDITAESLAGSENMKINPPPSLSNTNLIVPNGHMSENDISNILESNMDSIIEQDSSNNSSYISNSNYGFTGSTGSSASSTPIAPGKHGSFFASLLGGSLYQNRTTSILSPAFKSRANPTAALNTTGHTSTMHDFVPESGKTLHTFISIYTY